MDTTTPISQRTQAAAYLNNLLAEARRRLIEIGTRNRLVHTNRTAKRPSTLAVVQRASDALFHDLVREEQSLRFRPDLRLVGREAEGVETPVLPPDPLVVDAGGLQTRLGPDALQKRLLKFFRDARTLEEEQGINILYLAIGFLRWYEDENSNVQREAPLVLVPVTLVRDARRSTFDLRAREDDISTNLPLSERLKEFGISLPEIPEDDGWLPSAYFEAIQDAISAKPRWSIDPDGVELGLFSFAKLLMFHDLDGESWPQEAILDHPLIRALLVEGFALEEPLFSENEKIDQRFKPADLIHVVDADGSQTLAIETVRAGKNLVIQGPPGTGKSQTIANVIASAVHDGKSVLFVAEKMVALQVVRSRLKEAGIGACCLELHSRAANKRSMVEELGQTIGSGAVEPNVSEETSKLQQIRDRLNDIASRLHAPIEKSATTPFQLIGRLAYAAGAKERPPELAISLAICCEGAAFERVEAAAARLVELMKRAGSLRLHPWRGVHNLQLQPLDIERLNSRLRHLIGAITALKKLCADGAEILSLAAPTTLREIDQFVSILQIVNETPVAKADALKQLSVLSSSHLSVIGALAETGLKLQESFAREQRAFVPAAFQCDAASMRPKLARGTASWLARWGSNYRAASAELATCLTGQLPKSAAERVALVDRLLAVQELRRNFSERGATVAPMLGAIWAGEHTDFRGVINAYLWLLRAVEVDIVSKLTNVLFLASTETTAQRLLSRIKNDASELKSQLDAAFGAVRFNFGEGFGTTGLVETGLNPIAERFTLWSQSQTRYFEWAELFGADQELRNLAAADIADRLADGRLEPTTALAQLSCARAELLWRHVLQIDPQLNGIAKQDRRALVDAFRRLELSRRKSVAALIRARHSAGVPRGVFGDMAVVRGEIARRRGHMPIRKLISRAGDTIQKIKPVFMMSPISVAQYLPPGSIKFDLVVIDEASQVRPEDALGVIARGRQVVVVGDKKQLPPTTFFSRLLDSDANDGDDEEEVAPPTTLSGAAKVTELESILTLAEARGIPSRMLRWHYRSRHPSLIEVSNAEFYKSNLFLPPSPAAERNAEGLLLRRVAGAYDRGGKRTNIIEAQAIVDAIAQHAGEQPELSLGVVGFSTAQRDLIIDLLDEKRRNDPALESFLTEERVEECFVKNLENVQGDERDIIFISVGYGPRTVGNKLDSMGFGPVSSEGGERRLNVLFTRARIRTEVFVSFGAGDIDLERARGEGPRILKRFLAFAESGVLDQPIASGADYDSFFEQDVANVARDLGYSVDAQVGSAGFKIDLAVRDPNAPGRYLAAIECDGATYHHALWARERDRLRQDVLENLGWRFYRIWSTDWFYRRTEEIERLRQFLQSAKSVVAKPVQPIVQKPAPEGDQPILVRPPDSQPYRVAEFSINRRQEPHEISARVMSEIVDKIIGMEGPIHAEELARRVASLWGKDRTGTRIAQAVQDGLDHLRRSKATIRRAGEFWFTQEQEEDCPIRDRANAINSLQRAEMLPPLEIRACAFRVLEENGAIGRDEIAVAVTRMLGFQRTGSDLRAKIDGEIGSMLKTGIISEDQGRLVRPSQSPLH